MSGSRFALLRGLTTQIILALILGGLLGWVWPGFGQKLEILATIFIRQAQVDRHRQPKEVLAHP
ncbi:hypothetical protein MYX77_13500, partial [Acidobacteriia bacterium AH_259_A11_L15]|nr:hypothetical protein [Acidobacteriia bacterium AH_259_A11_L15]